MTTDASLAGGVAASTSRTLPRRRRRAGRFGVDTTIGHVLMVALSLLSLAPIYWMLLTSFRPEDEVYDARPWTGDASLGNYVHALNAIPVVPMMLNTFVIALAVTVVQLFTGLLAGYAFARWKFRFDWVADALIALTWLVPVQVVMIPNYLLIAHLGLLDSIGALILPHFASALAVMLMTQAMRAFPKEVLEASRMDGARSWRTLWQVVVPNLGGTIASLAILIFITTWNDYFRPLLLSRTPQNSVIQIGIQMFITSEGTAWGPLMAASSMASVPILLVYVVLQRQVVQSFMKSGLR